MRSPGEKTVLKAAPEGVREATAIAADLLGLGGEWGAGSEGAEGEKQNEA